MATGVCAALTELETEFGFYLGLRHRPKNLSFLQNWMSIAEPELSDLLAGHAASAEGNGWSLRQQRSANFCGILTKATLLDRLLIQKLCSKRQELFFHQRLLNDGKAWRNPSLEHDLPGHQQLLLHA